MTADPFESFKVAQRENWKSFAPLAMTTTPSAAKLVAFAGVRPDAAGLETRRPDRVQHVATGIDDRPHVRPDRELSAFAARPEAGAPAPMGGPEHRPETTRECGA